MSEDIYGERNPHPEGDHLVVLLRNNGTKQRWFAQGAVAARTFARAQRAANKGRGRVRWFSLPPMGGAR